MVTATDSHTTLHGSALWLARGAWFAVMLFAIGYSMFWALSMIAQPLPLCTVKSGVCNTFYLGVEDVAAVGANAALFEGIARSFFILNALASLTFIVVALIIVWRKSNDWMALLISAILIALGAVGIAPSTAEILPKGTALYFVQGLVSFFGYFGPLIALFCFPDGRFVPRWTRWVCLALTLMLGAFYLISESMFISDDVWILFGIVLGMSTLVGIGSMVYRYRVVATPLQRQQIKWVVLGLLMTTLSVLLWVAFSVFLPAERPTPTRSVLVAFTFPLILIVNAFFPVSVAIAMVRYRLWDIDILIRRTVTYALVTGILAGVFFGSVILLQQIFAQFAFREQNALVTVLSTLAIAALFVPLRHRMQREIDKRFNRKKYDAQQVLQEFAQTVRDETDLEKLTARLVEVVNETMQPKSVSVWLKREETLK